MSVNNFILLGALLPGTVFGAAALLQANGARRLRDRIRLISGAGEPVAVMTPPSIRVPRSGHGPAVGRFLRLMRFNPDIPQEQIVPWPVVMLLGLTAAALSVYRLTSSLGLPLALPAGFASGLLTARFVFAWQHARYCDAVFRQIPDVLGTMVRAVRAGLPLTEAVRGISREMPSPSKEEFARIVGDIAIGRPIEAALNRLHERTGLTEYAFLAVTLGMQSQTGGSLAETLDNLAQLVRKRVALAKRAKALAAEARMQAGLLMVLPFIAALMMSFLQPFYLTTFTQTEAGQRMALVGLGLMFLGMLTMRWLIKQAGRD
jgi:tight adherence protein B